MLFYSKGSSLFKEINQVYALYKSKDPQTLARYQHLFNNVVVADGSSTPSLLARVPDEAGTPEPTGPDSGETSRATSDIPPFVHFQQTLVRDKVKTMSDAESAAVEQLIEEHYAAAINAWEHPWLKIPKATKGSKKPKKSKTSKDIHKTDEELEAEYYQK